MKEKIRKIEDRFRKSNISVMGKATKEDFFSYEYIGKKSDMTLDSRVSYLKSPTK